MTTAMSLSKRPKKARKEASARKRKVASEERTFFVRGGELLAEGMKSFTVGNLQAALPYFKDATEELDPSSPSLTAEGRAECEPLWQFSKGMEMVCEGVGKARTLDYEHAKDDLTRARSELRAALENVNLNDDVKLIARGELLEIDYLLPSVDASLRNAQRDFEGASKAFEQAVRSIDTSLQSLAGNPALEPLASLLSGLRLFYSAQGKMAEAQYRSETGESDISVTLCEQASSELTEAKVHFIEISTELPQTQIFLELSGNILTQFLPVYISQYKNTTSLQRENQRLKQRNSDLESMLGRAATTASTVTVTTSASSTASPTISQTVNQYV
jgi:hypothetical protein